MTNRSLKLRSLAWVHRLRRSFFSTAFASSGREARIVLFNYPVEAASVNWLHECLANAVREGMDDIDARRPRVIWPDCIATAWRERLRRFTQLEERLTALMRSYEALGEAARFVVRRAMDDQSALGDLFDGQRVADRLDKLPGSVRDPLKLLFEKAFQMLQPLGIRDANYRKFLEVVPHHICPFCGRRR